MPLGTLPFATWHAVVETLRETGKPRWMGEHATRIERMRGEHGPGEDVVALFPSDDVNLRSYTHTRRALGLPLPPPR